MALARAAVVVALVLAAGAWPSAGQAASLNGPVMANWLSDMAKTIRKTKKALEDAAAAVALSDMDALDMALDRAIANIDQVLDPGIYPSLDPPSAGSIDYSVDPDTIQDYAVVTVLLATEADNEVNTGDNFDNDLVGTRLRTLKHLITRVDPHNYRTIAGLDE
jgi:hypothetical protein